MSCNGCRVLRKGCSESCILRPSLQWIQSPDAQANATLFVTKFFGRSDLMTFISAVPDHQKPALFQSLLFEACGRTVNPVNGAIGLLWSGKWHLCQAAVDTVLSGGTVSPIPGILAGNYTPGYDESSETLCTDAWKVRDAYTMSTNLNSSSARPEDDLIMSTTTPSFSAAGRGVRARGKRSVISYNSEQSSVVTSFGGGDDDDDDDEKAGNKEAKLLNLFV